MFLTHINRIVGNHYSNLLLGIYFPSLANLTYYLMFLKRKRCGKIKARGCADGRPQREYLSKDESSSPTVSIYALMTSCLMDAIEGRKVATCDIPGAFLQVDWPADRDCYLKFDGVMVSMICDINPK